MFNYVFLIVLCFMFVLYLLRLGIEFSRLMAHYKCILLLLLLFIITWIAALWLVTIMQPITIYCAKLQALGGPLKRTPNEFKFGGA